MKKIFLLIFISVFVLCSCQYDLYAGKRPFDYPSTKWVSAEISAWFAIMEDDGFYNAPIGEMIIYDRATTIEVRFTHGTNQIHIYKKYGFANDQSDRILLFEGTCKFSPEELKIKVVKNNDAILTELPNEIVFVREDIDEQREQE